MPARRSGSNVPPTLEEVTNYCLDRRNGINPEEWWCYYDAKGWMIGKNKMVNWQSAIRTWEIRNKNHERQQQSNTASYQQQQQQQRMREYAEAIADTAANIRTEDPLF